MLIPPRQPLATAKIRELIEAVGKFVVGLTAASFAVGLLIVNIRLASYGSIDGGFTQSQYVLTGASWLILLAAGAAPWVSIWFCVDPIKREIALRHYFQGTMFIIVPLIFIFFTGVVAAILRDDSDSIRYTSTWQIASTIWAEALPFVVLAIAVFKRRVILDESPPDWQRPVLAIEVLLGTIILLALGVLVYAKTVYPRLSPAYGGGRPVSARILLRPGAESARRTLESVTGSKDACEIVIEAGEWMVVRRLGGDSSNCTMRLHRSDVLAIIRDGQGVVLPSARPRPISPRAQR